MNDTPNVPNTIEFEGEIFEMGGWRAGQKVDLNLDLDLDLLTTYPGEIIAYNPLNGRWLVKFTFPGRDRIDYVSVTENYLRQMG